MKAVKISLYVCSGLMAAAAIAGATDYQKAQKSGKLNTLYQEEKAVDDPLVLGTKKEIEFEDYSRGPIDEVIVEEETQTIKKSAVSKKAKSAVEPDVLTKVINESTPIEILQKSESIEEPQEETALVADKKEKKEVRKKINLESFSRGPINRKFRMDTTGGYIKDSTVDLTTKEQ